jgi:hypothetical protein
MTLTLVGELEAYWYSVSFKLTHYRDIQAFGYDEARLKAAYRARIRKQSKSTWRLYRQELYLNGEKKPFAIFAWKHALDRISIDQIYSPPVTE